MSTNDPPESVPQPAVPSAAPRPPSHMGRNIAVIVVVILVVLAAVFVYYAYLRPKTSPGTVPVGLAEGGFTVGQVVTFQYNGTNTFLCTPGLLTFFPYASGAAAKTNCEVGAASQNAVSQVPEWVLVPAFAGLSVFGVTALGANSRGFPVFGGTALLTDCGAGGSNTSCPNHPTYLYSPLFAAVEQHLGITTGYGGLPQGVLPTPAHDHLINTTTTFPNVDWGTVAVLVFDPNIWPARDTGTCTKAVADNLTSPTGNCLTTLAALVSAITTFTSANAAANGGSSPNPIWATLGNTSLQVVIPGLTVPGQIMNLNSNLYIPFAVQPGAPPTFPV